MGCSDVGRVFAANFCAQCLACLMVCVCVCGSSVQHKAGKQSLGTTCELLLVLGWVGDSMVFEERVAEAQRKDHVETP